MRPTIGITSSFALNEETDPPRERAYLLAAYTDAIFAAGGIPYPLPVPPAYDTAVIDSLLSRCDGVLFTGGYDLHPRNFGQEPHPETVTLHERRDPYELHLYRRADERRMPIFAICLGFQVVHVARGGRLIQHVDDLTLTPTITHHLPRDGNAFHKVRVEGDSRLAKIVGGTEIETNSRHHQVVDPDHQGTGLRPVAFAPDGILEASEDCDGRYLVAVQWHPEDLIDRPVHLRLFEALVEAAAAGVS